MPINEPNAQIAYVLAGIDAALAKGFQPVAPGTLPARAEFAQWHGEILRAPLPAAPGFSVYIAPEKSADTVRLIRFDRDLEIIEYQTPLAVSVWVRRKGRPIEDATADDFARVARQLFKLTPQFSPRPAADGERAAVSTAPERDIYNMPAWSDRVDAGVHAGYMHFLFYKRHSQLVGLGLHGPWLDTLRR